MFENRLCPSKNLEEFVRVKNGYTNYKERESFQVEIVKCNPKKFACHEDPKEIENFMD